MAKKIIFTGTVGNDKTGDKLRTAFTKINENFDELYANVATLSPSSIQGIGDKINTAFDVANAAYSYANTIISENTDLSTVFNVANAAYNAANNTVTDFSPAFNVANAAYDYANTIVVPDVSGIYTVANAAFDAANNAVTDFSPAYNRANDAYDLANNAYNYANTIISENTNLTDVFNVANAAFNTANTNNVANIRINDLIDVDVDYNAIMAGYVLKWDGNKWSAAIDATSGGGGTDADTLDGHHAEYYLNYNNFANTPDLTVYETKTNVANSLVSANNYAGEMANAANAYASSLTPDLTAANNYAGFMANSVNAYTSATYSTVTRLTDNWVAQNNAYVVANAAFDKANSANVLAYNTGIGANAYASSVGVSANAYATAMDAASNAYANVIGASVNAYANVVGAASNNWANTLLTTAATATIGNVNVTYVLDSGRFTKLSGVEESFATYSSVTGLFNFDCSNNYIFYVTPTGNFTANLQNFLLDSNNVTSVTMVINQGVTPYMSINNILINGANNTINWQGGTAPTGTASKKDILTLSIMNINGANTVLGQLVSFG